MTNTVAYWGTKLTTVVKSFIAALLRSFAMKGAVTKKPLD
jgi:hypothetical protein